MMYFVKSVTTVGAGGCHTGEVMQAVAKRFEHTLLENEFSLGALVHELTLLAYVCNRKYKGAAVVHHRADRQYIYAGNVNSDGTELAFFVISYMPIGDGIQSREVSDKIVESLWSLDRKAFRPSSRNRNSVGL